MSLPELFVLVSISFVPNVGFKYELINRDYILYQETCEERRAYLQEKEDRADRKDVAFVKYECLRIPIEKWVIEDEGR